MTETAMDKTKLTCDQRKEFREALSAPERQVYDKAYNQAKSSFSGDEGKAHEVAAKALNRARKEGAFEKSEPEVEVQGEVVKLDEDKRQAFGWFYVSREKDGTTKRDHSGEHAPIEEVEKAIYRYLRESRRQGEMHVRKGQDYPVGELIEAVVFTPEKKRAMGIPDGVLPDGVWGGFQVNDEVVWKGIKAGVYPMFSIAGKGKRKAAVEKDAAGQGGSDWIAAAKANVEGAESRADLSELGKAYLDLAAAEIRGEAIQKGVGPNRHGPSIKCPDIYEALRREGKSKTTAAKISNECASSANCNCH